VQLENRLNGVWELLLVFKQLSRIFDCNVRFLVLDSSYIQHLHTNTE